ncbi:MAG: SDR family oxidoreductase [Chloroflexi bacterium]|nr:SDR family oxidoreductase [Chloroflexota bacterium]MDA1241183.1 SDR family oxidoreductase [Chloroflexota bacterium]
MDMGLTGRVAIVTGGSEGIGKAAALSMAREGARVAIAARRPDVLEAAAAEIRAATGSEVIGIPCDARDESQIQAMVAQVVERWGGVDILVNNAGTSAAAPFDRVDDATWNEDLGLKVYGAIYCARAVLPHMKAAGGGRIINVTTPGGKAPGASSLPTSLARAAGLALTKAMSKDYAADGILVNAVCIGLIKSGQHERRYEREQERNPSRTLDEFYEGMGGRVPLGRVGEASEAGDVICFLASARASYLSGTAINIDGGTSPVL